MAAKIIVGGLMTLAVSLGAGSALGTNLAQASVEGADPAPAVAVAMSAPIQEIDEPAWAADRVLIDLVDGAAIDGLAEDYRVAVVRAPIGSGYGVIGVPERLDRETFITRIRDDLRVADVSRMPEDGAAGDGMVGL